MGSTAENSTSFQQQLSGNSTSEMQRAAGRPSTAGDAAATTPVGRTVWASVRGTGGHHFLCHDDWKERHEAKEARKWDQRAKLNAEHNAYRILEHQPIKGKMSGHLAKLNHYDINGLVLSSGIKESPPPEQNPRAHWT